MYFKFIHDLVIAIYNLFYQYSSSFSQYFIKFTMKRSLKFLWHVTKPLKACQKTREKLSSWLIMLCWQFLKHLLKVRFNCTETNQWNYTILLALSCKKPNKEHYFTQAIKHNLTFIINQQNLPLSHNKVYFKMIKHFGCILFRFYVHKLCKTYFPA